MPKPDTPNSLALALLLLLLPLLLRRHLPLPLLLPTTALSLKPPPACDTAPALLQLLLQPGKAGARATP